MYKIAILGVENSHADTFLDFYFNKKRYPDIEVVGLYSEESDAAERLSKEFGVPVAKSYDEFVGKVDGIMITARHGKNHYKYAKPYIATKTPMFIDKPISADYKEAVEFAKDLYKNGVQVSGGSILMFAEYVAKLKNYVENTNKEDVFGGFFRTPVSLVNEYGNFSFYAAHLIQAMSEVFGYFPKSVLAVGKGKTVTGIVRYDYCDVSFEFVDGNYTYYASVSTKDGVEGAVYKLQREAYHPEMDEFVNLVRGGKMEHSFTKFIAPVAVMSAMEEALNTGKEVEIVYEEIN